MFRRIIHFFSIGLIILGCAEERIVPGDVPDLLSPPKTNSAPSDFTVTVKEVSSDQAILDWGQVYDADGDSLYYSVYVNDTKIASLTNDLAFKITGLKPETEYKGKVMVTDAVSKPKEALFTFNTKKHFVRFDKIYSNYVGKIPEGFSMSKTNDGGYVIAGNIGFDQNGYGLFILKIDSLGYEQWHSEVEGHYGTFDGTIIQTKDNGFVVVDQATVTKINSNGDLQWQRFSPIWYQQYNSVVETDDFGYLVVGMMGGLGPARGTLTKFDKTGTQEWEKLFDGGAAITISSCSQIVKGPGNDYTLAGTHQKPDITFELAVARIDALGNIYWIKTYEHPWQTFYMGVEIKTTADGFIIGSTSLEVNSSQHARMVKINKDGSLVWDRTFQWGGYETTCRAVRPMEDGNFLFVGGYTNSLHYRTAILVNVNSNGQLLWKKDYKPTTYQDFVWEFRDVEQTADKGFLLMGIKSWIWSGDGKDKGLWLLKTDENGD